MLNGLLKLIFESVTKNYVIVYLIHKCLIIMFLIFE